MDVVRNCPEMAGVTFLQDVFLPLLTQKFSELQIQTNQLQEDMVKLNPILAQLFPITMQKNQLHTRPTEIVQQAQEV